MACANAQLVVVLKIPAQCPNYSTLLRQNVYVRASDQTAVLFCCVRATKAAGQPRMHFGDDREGDGLGNDCADVDADGTSQSRLQLLGERSELLGNAPPPRRRP